jgi:murein DD-endopeptidase MepM/ murein hydrolase activator NlpD
VEEVVATNNLVNPTAPLRIGQTLAVVSRTGSTEPQVVAGQPHVVAPGESLLMIAARYGLSPLTLADANGLSFPAYVFAGQRIRIPGVGEYRDLPGGWLDIQVRPLPVVQGSTISIYVENRLDERPTGRFAGQTLHFVERGSGYVALAGLDAFTAPGYYPLVLDSFDEYPGSLFQQEIPIQSGSYETQSITVGEDLDMLLDPEVRAAEDALFASIYGRFSEPQQWEGLFQLPLTRTVVTAPYGVGRSYNNGPVDIYHTGIDFAEAAGVSVLAPATGTVVFTGQLDVRGITLIIDHGLGVMSGYYHLADTFVEEGDNVTSGQKIASVGTTGLSTGPHLHWDVRIMNVPVDGFQWTREIFP